jgi:hypothetical protein
VLVAPLDKEELFLHISATPQVISVVLVVEREEEDPGDGSPDTGREELQEAAEKLPIPVSHLIYKDINRAIIYAPGSSHAYIQQNYQDITTHIPK